MHAAFLKVLEKYLYKQASSDIAADPIFSVPLRRLRLVLHSQATWGQGHPAIPASGWRKPDKQTATYYHVTFSSHARHRTPNDDVTFQNSTCAKRADCFSYSDVIRWPSCVLLAAPPTHLHGRQARGTAARFSQQSAPPATAREAAAVLPPAASVTSGNSSAERRTALAATRSSRCDAGTHMDCSEPAPLRAARMTL